MKLISAAVAGVLSLSGVLAASIQRGLLESLNTQPKDIMISFTDDRSADLLNSLDFPSDETRGARAAAIVQILKENAEYSQRSTREFLKQFDNLQIDSLWISNQLHIQAATADLVDKLSKHEGVAHIRESLVINLEQPSIGVARNTSVNKVEWNIAKINAPQVWDQGNRGQGIVVANIDTGVHVTHEALKDNFRGNYSWFDPYSKSTSPFDGNGHGTHTMGTIAGQGGIGVAPGAKWIACRGCDTSSCTEVALVKCGEFMACPHAVDGSNPDCSKIPHLVSNSWGGGQGDAFYEPVTKAWRKAGIIPIFANGNDGPSCNTASSPADYNSVIAVGSTTDTDAISSFSSRGPAVSGLTKPDVSAPGSDVRSAVPTSDTSYAIYSGTSMATPHVAGAVALLLANVTKILTYDEVYHALTASAERNSLTSNGRCGSIPDNKFPNNAFGFGRLDSLKALGPLPPPVPTDAPTPTNPPAPECHMQFDGSSFSCQPAQFCKFAENSYECVPK